RMYDTNREYFDRKAVHVPELLNLRRTNFPEYLRRREEWVQSHTRVFLKYQTVSRHLMPFMRQILGTANYPQITAAHHLLYVETLYQPEHRTRERLTNLGM